MNLDDILLDDVPKELLIPKNIIWIVERDISEMLGIAEKRFTVQFIPPRIDYRRIGLNAGYATRNNYIALNSDYLLQGSSQVDMLTDTVPHELAHIIWFQLFKDCRSAPKQVHGAEWRNIFRLITRGKEPSRCHDYDGEVARLRSKRK